MAKYEKLFKQLSSTFNADSFLVQGQNDEITLTCPLEQLTQTLQHLKEVKGFMFDQLIDLCGVDYLHYGQYDWETDAATERGFSRGVAPQESFGTSNEGPRFAVVYHLLSTVLNLRLRVKTFVHETHLIVPSVINIWKSADWFEREAYDVMGILFEGHPDLRRILTDYGFIGHPFRKDFPLSGHVEMRYDATLAKVIYEPIELKPRVLVPKVIREDNRYRNEAGEIS